MRPKPVRNLVASPKIGVWNALSSEQLKSACTVLEVFMAGVQKGKVAKSTFPPDTIRPIFFCLKCAFSRSSAANGNLNDI